MDKGKRGRGGGVTRGGLFRLIASDRPPRPPPTMPDREPSAGQPPTIGGRPPPPAPRTREPAAATAPAAFRQVAQWRHGLLLHLPPKKAVTVALIAYYGNSSSICNRLSPSPRPAQRPRLRSNGTGWPADQLTTAPCGGWFTDLATGSAQNLSTTLPPPLTFFSSHVLIHLALPPLLRGGSLENRGQKTEKSKRGPKKIL